MTEVAAGRAPAPGPHAETPTAGEMRISLAVVLTALSGVAMALAFPTAGVAGLAWVGLAPFLAVVSRSGLRATLGLGVLWSLIFWIVIWNWGPAAVSRYFGQSLLVGIGFLVATQGLLLLPWLLVHALLHRLLARRFVVALPLLSAAAWVATDLARIRLFTGSDVLIGNPWAVIGYSQADLLPLVQVASLAGVYALCFVLVASNAALATLALGRLEGGLDRRRAAGVLASGLGPGLLALAFGGAVLARAPVEEGGVRVALIQGNLDVASRWRSDFYGRNLRVYLRLTRETLLDGPAEVVFWPEAAMTFFVEEEESYRWAVGQVLTAGGTELVAGSPRREQASPTVYHNSVYRIAPDGSIAGRYDKQLLLPFAEFNPLGGLDLVRRSFGAVREFSPGPVGDPLPTAAGLAGVLICNEIGFPTRAHARVAAGAEFLLNPANDGWVGDPQYSEQMFQIARLRAVEERRYLVRPSTAGPSAIVDPWGRVQVRTQPFTRATITGTIRPRSDRTLYSRTGDLFAFGCALVAALAAWRARR